MHSSLSRAAETSVKIAKVAGLSGFAYYGERSTIFPIHTEDGDFWSINYLHYGAPKIWYVTAQSSFEKVSQLIRAVCLKSKDEQTRSAVKCPGFLRHKQFQCSPQWLLDRNVQVYRLVQKPGMYVIIRPGVLHWGFNCGFNVAEAANFALESHYTEIADIRSTTNELQYKFRVCRSGWIPHFKQNRNLCEIGQSKQLPMFFSQRF